MRSDFVATVVRPIFALLSLVLAHIYEKHFDVVVALHQVAHLNGLFVHFIAFAREFSLLPTPPATSIQQLAAALLRANTVAAPDYGASRAQCK